ncbi:uncharacterized protein [Ptychodera flava]|uniref:uncharacterized protein n=1 Tax=Ptychodera flava TaxID=63121 RepID=UPI00396A6A74
MPPKKPKDSGKKNKNPQRSGRQGSVCTKCDKICKSDKALHYHFRAMHEKKTGQLQNRPHDFGCNKCGKICKSDKALFDHFRAMHEKKTGQRKNKPHDFVCTKCGRICRNEKALWGHIKICKHLKKTIPEENRPQDPIMKKSFIKYRNIRPPKPIFDYKVLAKKKREKKEEWKTISKERKEKKNKYDEKPRRDYAFSEGPITDLGLFNISDCRKLSANLFKRRRQKDKGDWQIDYRGISDLPIISRRRKKRNGITGGQQIEANAEYNVTPNNEDLIIRKSSTKRRNIGPPPDPIHDIKACLVCDGLCYCRRNLAPYAIVGDPRRFDTQGPKNRQYRCRDDFLRKAYVGERLSNSACPTYKKLWIVDRHLAERLGAPHNTSHDRSTKRNRPRFKHIVCLSDFPIFRERLSRNNHQAGATCTYCGKVFIGHVEAQDHLQITHTQKRPKQRLAATYRQAKKKKYKIQI